MIIAELNFCIKIIVDRTTQVEYIYTNIYIYMYACMLWKYSRNYRFAIASFYYFFIHNLLYDNQSVFLNIYFFPFLNGIFFSLYV